MAPNKLAISTISLSQHPSHLLDSKILSAAKAGYQGLEIVFSDLTTYASAKNLPLPTAASNIKSLCDASNIEILALAPFENYEGSKTPLEDRLNTAREWIGIARILRAPYLQVPSQFGVDGSRDYGVVVEELRALADLGSETTPIVAIAYENLSWGTAVSTWEDALRVVDGVGRANFGLCLDTFHILTKLWADPFVASGKFPDADEVLAQTLKECVAKCPVEKIFYIQLSDGERFDPPFSKSHPWYVEGEAEQFTWSKHARPFPFERELGAYMPVADIAKAWIVEMGFKGYVSMEIFDRRMRDKSALPDDAARRGVESWKKVQAAIGVAAKL